MRAARGWSGFLAGICVALGLLVVALPARAAVDPSVPGEILVKLAAGSALPGLLARYPVTLVDRFGARPIYRLKVVGNARAKDVIEQLRLEPGVLIAEFNARNRSPEARKNMPWVIGSAGGYRAQWGPQAMRLPQAQQLARGAGVRVAVLDTGVDAAHPLLAPRLEGGFDFVDFDADPSEAADPASPGWGHGTHVAGLVALAAPDARIMPVRVLDADGAGNAWVLAEALLWALDPDGNPATDDGAHVVNLSLGSLSRTRVLAAVARIATCQPAVAGDPIDDRSDPGYADDERRCAARPGAVLVAAAGNDATDGVRQYPAAESVYGLVAVGASNADNLTASFSNWGSWVGLAAPGDGITSALPGGRYGTWSGTSMAAPLVAGTAALVRSAAPALSPRDLVRRMRRAATPLCDDKLWQLDAEAAVAGSRTPVALACP